MGGFSRHFDICLLPDELQDQAPAVRLVVEVHEDNLLPRTEGEPAVGERHYQAGAD